MPLSIPTYNPIASAARSMYVCMYAARRVSFPKFSRQFFDYFPKIIDTRPKIVDTFLKTLTIILNLLTLPVDSLSICVVEDRTARVPGMVSYSRCSCADVYRYKR